MNKKIKIEIQHFHGCPNSPELIKRVNEALKGLDNIDYEEIIIDSNKKAMEFKFRGSPTLLINGEDFENMPEPEQPALMCRYYPKGLPNVNNIKKRILN